MKALVAAGFFVSGFIASAYLVRELPVRAGKYPREARMPEIDVPKGREYFFVSGPHELSQSVLYHDLGDSISNARRADVLFLGNSQMPLALREEFLVPKAERLGVRLFSLGVGHAENGRFPLEIIRKYDLRPKIVVANATAGFFDRRGRFSPPSREAMAGSRWDAMKRVFEGIGTWRLQLLLHSFLPKVDFLDQRLMPKQVMYRSSRTGWWYPALEPRGRYPIRINPPEKSFDHLLPFAREYKQELDARGALLVLTHIPGGKTYLAHLPLLTRELGVPLVAPRLDGLQTTDGAHFDRESARRFSEAFWDEFIALPAVRERLSIPPAPGKAASDEAQGDDARLQATRDAVVQMRSMLEEYYGGPDVLRKTWYLQPDDPRYRKGIDFLADKIARAFVWGDRFAIGAIGSSVTAGFDNCHYDTYQEQLERLTAPIWKAAGVDFEVRNTGQGGECGDSFDNQVWCLRTLVGDDVDMTHYSWTYFEAGSSPEERQLYHELFYRWSLLMERSPVPQIIYTNDCEKLSRRDQDLLDAYGPFGADVLCMQRGIKTVGYSKSEWGAIGDSIHTTTRYGEAPGVGDERRRSLGVVFRNWHPGPLLFQITADALAYKISDAMLLALDRIASEPQPAVRWPKRPPRLARSELPNPLACPPEWCGAPEPPRCLDYEEPTFGEQHFRRMDPRDPENPHRTLADPSDAGWTPWKDDPGVRNVPKPERQLPECAHPARCAGLEAPPAKQAGWLTFELPRLDLGFVAVCCSKKRCGQLMLEAGAEFLLDGAPPASPPQPIRNGKCVEVQSRFADGKARTVHLGIRLPAREEPIPAITHVIGL